MNWKQVVVVYRKELMDILRDRRTIFGMFIFPLMMFPLLTVGINRFIMSSAEKAKKDSAEIMLIGDENAPALAKLLRETDGLRLVPFSSDYAAQISEKKLRAAVEFPKGFEEALRTGAEPPPQVKVYFYRTEIRSEGASDRIEDTVQKYRESIVAAKLAARGLPAAILKPIETKEENVAAAQKVAGGQLAMIVPYFIVFLSFMGAMHPAMDVTAGEKERGTMETILASGVGRGELVFGKFLLVLTVSLVTTCMSLISFAISTNISKTYMQQVTQGHKFSMSIGAAGAVLLLALPMAVLFAGTLIAVALLAKSYKEAQSYISPMIFLVIFPAMAGMMPGMDLKPSLAVIPILNVSLVCKELFTGNFPWLSIAIAFGSMCGFAGVALYAAMAQFQREEVLFRT